LPAKQSARREQSEQSIQLQKITKRISRDPSQAVADRCADANGALGVLRLRLRK
jgi:hypothetical protein